MKHAPGFISNTFPLKSCRLRYFIEILKEDYKVGYSAYLTNKTNLVYPSLPSPYTNLSSWFGFSIMVILTPQNFPRYHRLSSAGIYFHGANLLPEVKTYGEI